MMLYLVLYFALLLPSVHSQRISQECNFGFKGEPNGKSCYRVIFATMSWDEAQNTCKILDANLASVTSKAEMEFIWDNIASEVFYHYWIGLYKNSTDANNAIEGWRWIDGTKYDISWAMWSEDQPRPNDKYGLMYMSFIGDKPHWLGEKDGNTKHVFICEHEIENENTSATPDSPVSVSSSVGSSLETSQNPDQVVIFTTPTFPPEPVRTSESSLISRIMESVRQDILTSESDITKSSALSTTTAAASVTENKPVDRVEGASPSSTHSPNDAIGSPVPPDVIKPSETTDPELNPECPNGFLGDKLSKNCYRAFFVSKNWTEAQQTCREYEANLLSVTSMQEVNFIWDNIVHAAIYFYWIGIYKTTDSKQGWGWIDGTTYDTSWTLWGNGQPRTNDEVATMFLSFTNTQPHWTGVSDKKFKNKFICKYVPGKS